MVSSLWITSQLIPRGFNLTGSVLYLPGGQASHERVIE